METRILLPRILLPDDKETITQFEKACLAQSVSDPMEREMAAWSARWRPEALDHYLPQGWSFGAFGADGKLVGYLLAQPYLFHRGLTQTLWIEHLTAPDSREALRALIDTTHKWAKDKHFQTVLLEKNQHADFILEEFPKAMLTDGGFIELRSARF